MTRDNPSIATKVNTMTSSVIILLLGNARLRCLCHRSVRQEKIMETGVAEQCSVRVCPICIEDYLQSPFLCLKSSVSARSFPNSSPKITKSRVQSPCCFVCFFVDFPVSGVVRAKPQKVELCCNVKLLYGMPPRPSQWNFLLEN